MSNKDYVDDIAPDLAAKLASDLHSSADENIISSMLAASLNESEDFMKWFCRDKAGFMRGKRDFGKLWSTANDRIPRVITDQIEPACRYRRPDIIVWNREDEQRWKDAEDEDNDDNARAAMRDVDAVFVEVKKTHITDKEQKKYEDFVKCVSGLWSGSEKSVRFVIVSSHDSATAKRIRKGDLRRSNDYTADERRWVRLLRFSSRGIGVVHVTLEEVFQELNENKDYRQYRCLPLFKSYLALYTAQVDDRSYRESWKYLMRLYRDDYAGLRKEIVETIRSLAVTVGIDLGRSRNLEERMRAANLVSIREHAGGGYRLSLSHEGRNEVPVDELHVRIHRARKPIEFHLSDGSAESIADKIGKVRDKLHRLRQL